MRYFSLQEAEALIPELEGIFEKIAEIVARAESKSEHIRGLEATGADPAGLEIERAQLKFMAAGVNEWFQKIVDLGAIPKGLSPALVDFPSRLKGREVYLCWKLGDKKIAWYHGLEDGFGGRKPLP